MKYAAAIALMMLTSCAAPGGAGQLHAVGPGAAALRADFDAAAGKVRAIILVSPT